MAISKLVLKSIYLGKKKQKTSIKLEPEFWEMFQHICLKEGRTIDEMVENVTDDVPESRASAIRVYVVRYIYAESRQLITEKNQVTPHPVDLTRAGLTGLPTQSPFRLGSRQ